MIKKKKIVNAPYYNIGQLRMDLWNKLRTAAVGLGDATEKLNSGESQMLDCEVLLDQLSHIEHHFAFPGMRRFMSLKDSFDRHEFVALTNTVIDVRRELISDGFRSSNERRMEDEQDDEYESRDPSDGGKQNYFEVLLVEDMSESDERALHKRVASLRQDNDLFRYELVVQRSFQDALISLLFNPNIQSVVIRYAPPFAKKEIDPLIRPYIQHALDLGPANQKDEDLGPLLGQVIHQFRPEIDTYYVTDNVLADLKDSTINTFRRTFYRKEDFQEIHLSINQGIAERYETPFFTALMEYSKKPTGVFHAMPISRGGSVFKSHWIRDFGDFYGRNLFLAETSATTGGLDSLLQPTGPLKKAQELARDAYGSKHTFMVTNGTSTANKIVMQAIVAPEDVVLVDRDCHKSHHYGLVLSGAFPVYLDSYPIEKYSMYGAVPRHEIVDKLLLLRESGRLEKVKMLLLTNCTFDGMVYNVERMMEEVLAIKPDMVFLWDEAWFAFASFTYTFKKRTAMFVAKKLEKKYQTEEYRKTYKAHLDSLAEGEHQLMPDPDKVRIRVYATQSTHKTLSSFRQGSMIHIWDQDFRRKSQATFLEAYMTHTSTSPNYQMLASLDAGRRQVQFEGYELVERGIELAMSLRAKINDDPALSKYFDVLTVKDFIPAEYRHSELLEYYSRDTGWNRMETAWDEDEFVLDPTKVTLHIGRTGVDGDTFKNKFLMDKFSIQINKTSRNTVLFMTNIGTSRGSITYLINALLQISAMLDENFDALDTREREIHSKKVHSLTHDVPPLPDFSFFHHSFQAVPGIPGGNLREAFFLTYNEDNYTYVQLNDCLAQLEKGVELVASSFVIPYPPGFPVLVPGQIATEGIIKFMLALDVKEIHGFRADLGLRVFKQSVLDRQMTATSIGAIGLPGISMKNSKADTNENT
ncbi:MAG: arginine decarboxylase [Flavobacteriales bacterium]|jgi:arginine decarboxylase